MENQMSKTTDKLQITFSPETLDTIKKGANNYAAFKSSLDLVKTNAFIYGYKGGTTGETFTQHERFSINFLLEKIATVLELCQNWHLETGLKNSWAMINAVEGLNEREKEGVRFNPCELLHEAFKITFSWQFEADNDFVNEREIIPALNLWDWVLLLPQLVRQDYELLVADKAA